MTPGTRDPGALPGRLSSPVVPRSIRWLAGRVRCQRTAPALGSVVRPQVDPAAEPAGRISDAQQVADRSTYRQAIRRMASMEASTSCSVVAHELTLMRMAVVPCQTVEPAQSVPSF